MAVTVVAFGQIAEITGREFQAEVTDTDQLAALMRGKYQALGNIKYMVAVNKKVVTGNTPLQAMDTIALLPPYSGG